MKRYTKEDFKKACFEAIDRLRNDMEDNNVSSTAQFGVMISVVPYIAALTEYLFTEEVDLITIDEEN